MPKGFKAFRRPGKIDAEELKVRAEEGRKSEEFVFYTGGRYGRRKASGRSKALATITETRKPVSIATLFERAAKEGFDPPFVRNGLGLHSVAKPSIYLFVEKTSDGYRAVKDIPTADGAPFGVPGGYVSFEAGDLVLDAKGKPVAKGKREVAKT
jgi:hypothetical protein